MKTSKWLPLVLAATGLLWSPVLGTDLPAPEKDWTVPQPDKAWQLPAGKSQKWAKRPRELCPPGWTVTARGNDIILQRDQLVAFGSSAGLINAPAFQPGRSKAPDTQPEIVRDRVYRLTLQFAPLLSQDEYEKRAAQNQATYQEDHKLRRKHQVRSHKFGIIISTTDEAKKREQAYRQEAKKLIWHRLPHFYSTDYSITLYQSWNWLEYVDPNDEAVAAECNGVREALVKLFGVYDPAVADNRSDVGYAESSRGKF